MRIAIVSRYARKGDGQGRANREIAIAALAAGHNVVLYADQVDQDILDAGAKWIPVQPKTRSNDLAYGLQSIAAANRALKTRRSEYDVIHGYGWTLDGAHHINTAQFVHTAWLRHSMHPSRMSSGPYALYQRLYTTLNAWGERKTFRDARRVIGASSTIRHELTTLCGVADAKVGVVLNSRVVCWRYSHGTKEPRYRSKGARESPGCPPRGCRAGRWEPLASACR
jgi:hypothetical protein